MPLTTRATLRSEAARLIGSLLWEGTASSGSATTLLDAGPATASGGLLDSGRSSSLFSGAYLLLTSGDDSGDWRMITPAGDAPSSGTLTVGSAWNTGPSNGTTYEVYGYMDPSQWNEVIDDALAKLRYWYRSPITLVPDGDMETSGTSNWAATAGTTLSKVTTGSFVDLSQALRVQSDSANDRAATNALIYGNPGASYTVWADFRSDTGTAILRAVDENGTFITNDSGADNGVNEEGGMIHIGFTLGSGIRAHVLWLEGAESNADITWDNVISMRNGRRRYPLPAWVETRDQVHEILTRHGSRPSEYYFVSTGWPIDIEEDLTGVTPFRINLPQGAGAYPLYIRGTRAYGALATDASTTTCPLEWAKYSVAMEALERAPAGELLTERMGKAKMARIARRKSELDVLNMPREPRPSGPRQEWVATVGPGWNGTGRW